VLVLVGRLIAKGRERFESVGRGAHLGGAAAREEEGKRAPLGQETEKTGSIGSSKTKWDLWKAVDYHEYHGDPAPSQEKSGND